MVDVKITTKNNSTTDLDITTPHQVEVTFEPSNNE